ncbi:L,D-transpeptidase [Sphingomonas solaris]|uniref:L,D-transpeptidase n=1 Tax=Alterirhizorhabdus solaris TaxID=2529389 RepID=A0A558QV91_9SPHN|nr:L,D-transpeptidase [Sphingomonas solaris]TVV71029.1 L,D-transpeptidase [Sphingomonas solaris]
MSVDRLLIFGAVAMLAGLSAPAGAQGARTSSPAEFARAVDRLKPGEWVWAPNIAPTGPLLVYVDLSRQIATVYRNGVRIAVATVSSGKAGHETPTGVFTILQKDANHHSSLYNSAPMPFQQRLTWDGVALHAGGLPGYPESHGCVHLPFDFSRELFAITSLGATVVIAGSAIDHIRTSDASLLAPIDPTGRPVAPAVLRDGDFVWKPEKSPTGPLTIIVSKIDQRVVVLRNGVEIGRSVAQVEDDDPGSHVITLTVSPQGAARWVYVGLPGHDEDAGRMLDEATINRLRLPRRFYEQVKGALRPGDTILITNSSVGDDGRDRRITVMDAVIPQP